LAEQRRTEDLARVLHGTLLGDGANQAEVAILLADEHGFYIAVNDEASTLTGYSRLELTKFRAGELAADEASANIYQRLLSRKNSQGHKQVRRKDGGIVHCRYWGIPTKVANMPYFLLLLWPTRSRAGRAREAAT
jgi:PAS domain S-box-containing protein